jgi:hypothetical protein
MDRWIDRGKRDGFASQYTVARLVRRAIYCFRLGCGGAIGGFFVGTLLCGCIAILVAIKGLSVGLDSVLLGGACVSTCGGFWGLILGLTGDPMETGETTKDSFSG